MTIAFAHETTFESICDIRICVYLTQIVRARERETERAKSRSLTAYNVTITTESVSQNSNIRSKI